MVPLFNCRVYVLRDILRHYSADILGDICRARGHSDSNASSFCLFFFHNRVVQVGAPPMVCKRKKKKKLLTTLSNNQCKVYLGIYPNFKREDRLGDSIV